MGQHRHSTFSRQLSGDLLLTPIQRLQSFRRCPLTTGTMILWKDWIPQLGPWVFNFHELFQLHSQPCPESRPEQPWRLCVLQCPTGWGSCRGVWVRSPGRKWWLHAAPLGLSPAAREKSHPASCPCGSFDHATVPLLLALPTGNSSILWWGSHSLHLHSTSEKSCQCWQVGGFGWRQTGGVFCAQWEGTEPRGRPREERDREHGQPARFSQSWGDPWDLELQALKPDGLGQTGMVGPFRGSNHRKSDS